MALLYGFGQGLMAQEFKVMKYGVNDGLPQDFVYTMHQDHSGYLWVGTGDGLARYDGKSFTVFTDADSLCDNFITTSHINDAGSWFGHMNGGITLYNGKTFTKVLKGDLSAGIITDMKSTGNILWASTQSGGVWRIGPDLNPMLFNDPDNPVPIFSMEFLSSTEVVLGSMENALVYAIENETHTFRLITVLEGVPETKIQDLIMSKDNTTLYILTQDEGIYTYNTKQYTPNTEPLGIDMEAGIEGPQQIFEDHMLNLWIPTFGNGLYKLTPSEDGGYSSWESYTADNGLTDDNLKVVFEDREENIWLGMYGTGLSRLVDEAFTYYTFDSEGISNNIHSIYTTGKFIWLGTENGLIQYDRLLGEVRYLYGRTYGFPDDIVTAISGSADGNIWIGTDQSGVYHMSPEGNRVRKIHISEGNLENSINAMAFQDPYLWVATHKGVCKLDTESGIPTWYTIQNAGLPHNTINYLQVDETGKVWLSTLSNTVSYFQNDIVTHKLIPDVGGAVDIRSVTRDRNGNTWIGTDGSGVFKIAGDTAINYTTADGLIADYCYSLMGDDLGYIWISHRGGLSRIRLTDDHISPVKDEVGIDRSMEFNHNAAFKDSTGSLWFGSTSGVLSYNPKLAKKQSPPPAISITSLSVNNQPVAVGKQLLLPPGRYDLRITFVGVNLKNPDAVKYMYKMDGLGNAWSEEFTENYVNFNKLPDGEYVFYLGATNNEGVSGEGLKFPIIIKKPLWKRLWFYVILLALAAFGVVVYIKRREHNLLLEKQALEKAVKERTEEVVKQKEEIERQSDEISWINKNITDSIIYASRIQQALFPPEDQLTHLFPSSFIMNRPQYIVSGDFFWLANKDGKRVVTVSDCTGHGVPGAFMSMLGITLLNELVNTQGIMEADEILNHLKHEIIVALRQDTTSETGSDGMDMALCIYDPEESTLQYAGGFNPLVLIRNNELVMYKADPMPIGIGAITGRNFTKHSLDIQKGDVIYLYSDGYEDQFGGERNKKFSRKRFRNLLFEIHSLSMTEQKKTLEGTLDNWMDGEEQIDDITVMGIRF